MMIMMVRVMSVMTMVVMMVIVILEVMMTMAVMVSMALTMIHGNSSCPTLPKLVLCLVNLWSMGKEEVLFPMDG